MSTVKPYLDSALDHGVLVLTVLREQIEGEDMADTLREELTAAVARHGVQRVVLDLSNTRYISSIVFWPLLNLRRQLLEHDGSLIICGLRGPVQEVFTTTKMVNSAGSPNAPFEVAADRPQAVARLARLHTAN
ncbi:MAG: STAS domain-containing protein [Gemmataceae bacterium]